MLGHEVSTLVDGMQDAGFKSIAVDVSGLPSGVYMYQLTTGSFSDVKKMVVVR
jgi:hypothetical protein